MFLRKYTYELRIFHANQTTKYLRNQGRGLVDRKQVEDPPSRWRSKGGSPI